MPCIWIELFKFPQTISFCQSVLQQEVLSKADTKPIKRSLIEPANAKMIVTHELTPEREEMFMIS